MILATLHWLYAMPGHHGSQCMCAMLQVLYHHLDLLMHIKQFSFNECQQAKPSGPGHGLLPDQDIAGALWEKVAVDLISPWLASTPQTDVEFFDLTCIDTTTNPVK